MKTLLKPVHMQLEPRVVLQESQQLVDSKVRLSKDGPERSPSKFTMHRDYYNQYLFATLPLQPDMASLTTNNCESDLAEKSDHFATRDNRKPAQARTTLTTVTIGR